MRAGRIPHGAFTRTRPTPSRPFGGKPGMLDLLLLALGVGLFGLLAAYAAACERV
jgi:hypothetical protein